MTTWRDKNQGRAERAANAVARTGDPRDEACYRDLISDCLHAIALRTGGDVTAELAMAIMNFNGERAGDGFARDGSDDDDLPE